MPTSGIRGFQGGETVLTSSEAVLSTARPDGMLYNALIHNERIHQLNPRAFRFRYDHTTCATPAVGSTNAAVSAFDALLP